MKITFTGRQVELAPAQVKKVEARFAKIGKLLDGKKESEAHVVLSLVRKTHRAEATVTYYGHQLVGLASSPDLFAAIQEAAEKLEKQALKAREKWRDTRRTPIKGKEVEVPAAEAEVEAEPETEKRVYRVSPHKRRKPMTVEEALLEMDAKRDYLVYRDAETDKLSVLVRRKDGDFDLIEG